MQISPIQLTAEEASLYAEIRFDARSGHEALRQSCRAAQPLMRSLLDRKALPAVRVRYFRDPECNVGARRSRQQRFEDNGTTGDAIFGHGNFLKYLKYFIEGPHLPRVVIDGFCELIERDDDRGGARAYVRAQIRAYQLERRDAAEEFYKLALECGLDEPFARSLREAGISTR